jgi:diguanylate cyclase (GGDEF)-like protein
MVTFNTIFKSEKKLEEFIKKHNLTDKKVFLQIFTGVIDKEFILNLVNFVKELIPQVKIIGTTTDGEIKDSSVTTKETVLSFSVFESSYFETFAIKKTSNSFNLGSELGKKIKENAKALITFADGLNVNGESFLKGIESVKNDIIIAGGLAGDNAEFKKTYVFTESEIIDNGCVGAVFYGDKLRVSNTYGFNWQGIGKIMTVTKADKNIVYEIDNKTAVEVYRHYFGEDVAKDIVKIGVEFPLIIHKGNFKVARAVVGQNKDGSLVFAGNVNVGDKVQFGYGDIEEILKEDEKLFKSVSEYDVENIFIYSCMARRRFLGEKVEYEIKPFLQIAPVSGFFTYGEFFYNGKTQFLNQTMTVLFMSEKDNKKEINYSFEYNKNELRTMRALTNLIKTTSEELMELNEKLEEKVKEKTEEIIEKNKKLEYMYYHDSLTALPNKFMLEKDINKNTVFESVMIDIRQFSNINDLYGEKIGDELLKEFAKQISKLVKLNECKIYRVGGDQFIAVNFSSNEYCKGFIKNVFELSSKPFNIIVDKEVIGLSINVRIVCVKGDYKDLKLKADLALKYAKKNNLDFIRYSEDLKLEEKLEKEFKIIEMVKKALKEDRIIPVFQKIEKKEGITYECLVRIKEGNNLISPAVFLNIIKPTPYYFQLTKRMIEKSFKIFKDRTESISINFSYDDLENEEIKNFLIKKIDEYGMKGRVIIELLESENVKSFEIVKEFMDSMKDYDVNIAIDDFGSGYSNFIYLTKIKPQFIKIDGSLIKNIDKDNDAYIITKHINNFSKELGCKTIAEFVHSEEVLKKVKEIDVDGMQGYFIAPPSETIQ